MIVRIRGDQVLVEIIVHFTEFRYDSVLYLICIK